MILSPSRAFRTAAAHVGGALSSLFRGVYRLCAPAGRGLPALLLVAGGTTSCLNLNTYSVEDDVALGAQAFQEVTSTGQVLKSGPEVEQVERVTARLVDSVMELEPEIAPLFEWEVVVIDDPNTVNAFCLPGGKMAVYTGILPVTQTDAGLAVVMGHEITHATKRHGTQRLTRNGLTSGLIQAVFQDEDYEAMAEVAANFGIGLPWGREDELEADREGLMVMANAGYDPAEAPRFWERMQAMTGGGGGSGLEEFMSTHPSNAHRIEQLQELQATAMPIYEAAKAKK